MLHRGVNQADPPPVVQYPSNSPFLEKQARLMAGAMPGARAAASLAPGFGSPQLHRLRAMMSRERAALNRSEVLRRSSPRRVASLPPKDVGVRLGASIDALHAENGDFDITVGVECNRAGIKLMRGSPPTTRSQDACRELCAREGECVAAQYDVVMGTCQLWSECLWRDPAVHMVGKGGKGQNQRTRDIVVMHRVGREWPVPAARVKWRTNATLVVASFDYRLDWLRTVPPGIFDVALYRKHDYVANASLRTANLIDEKLPLQYMRDQPQPCWPTADTSAESSSDIRASYRQRIGIPFEPCPDAYCECGAASAPGPRQHALSYFRVLPNYGRTGGKAWANGFNPNPPGGSREPYAYLQFILDFWDNLPNVIIFTQDDCIARVCVWSAQLAKTAKMLRNWQQHWGQPSVPTHNDCLCKYVREVDAYKGRYYWWQWMSVLQAGLFNHTPDTRPQKLTLTWPQDANFAVGGRTVRATPRWAYELLLRLHVSERWCNGGSIHFAHSMERLWFEVFDPDTPKQRTWARDYGPTAMAAIHNAKDQARAMQKLSCLATAAGDGYGEDAVSSSHLI